MAKRVGIILAGGQSRRFGRPKAFAEYKGKPMFQHVCQCLQPYVSDLLVISHPSLTKTFEEEPNLIVIEDAEAYKGMGPLAGLYTALTSIEAEDYLLFPCDAPLVTDSYIKWLINKAKTYKQANGGVPISQGRLHPLMAFYRKGCLPYLEDLLKKDERRVVSLIEKADILQFEVDETINPSNFYNVNHVQSLREIE